MTRKNMSIFTDQQENEYFTESYKAITNYFKKNEIVGMKFIELRLVDKETLQKVGRGVYCQKENEVKTIMQENTTCAGCGNELAYDQAYRSDDGNMCFNCIFPYNNCWHCSKGTYNTVCNECKETFKEAND